MEQKELKTVNDFQEAFAMLALEYEGFICALCLMMLSKEKINYPQFTDTNLDKEMNKIWRWVREHKDNK